MNWAGADGMSPVAMVEPRAASPHEGDDADLLRRIVGGDRTALVALYQRHGGVVLAQIGLVVEDRGLSEEILQDTMLAVWRGAASFRGRSRVRSWIIAIARRQARDRLRRYRANVVDDGFLTDRPAQEPGPEDVALERAEAEAVANAIRSLGLAHREVLGLVFGAGLTLAETAEVLDVPLGTVKSRLAAARAALARSLSEKGYAR
ncbi:MAG: sigma-70 family RNA polymerase sigma factor [Streptosporangiales bacterium]|nr:sigma-70 family RNA polymerase sigma factor [Streptosporangiales bacterium]